MSIAKLMAAINLKSKVKPTKIARVNMENFDCMIIIKPKKNVTNPKISDHPQLSILFLLAMEKTTSKNPAIRKETLKSSDKAKNDEVGEANVKIPAPINKIPTIKGIYQFFTVFVNAFKC